MATKNNKMIFKPLDIKNRPFHLFLFLFIAMCSCVPYNQTVYLQEGQRGTYDQAKKTETYKVRKDDLLQINVKSLDDKTTTQEFFMGETQMGVAQGNGVGSGNVQLFLTSYRVDDQGMIDLPIIGKLKVEQKTLGQIELEIEAVIKEQAKYSKVTVSLVNFRVNVIGEVNSPGTQYIFDTSYTLFQALANAGDLTDFADRKRIRLLRNIDGKTKSVWFDLTDPKTLSSDNLYLLPDDMILVDPLKAKINRNNAQTLTIGISVISLLVTIISVTTR